MTSIAQASAEPAKPKTLEVSTRGKKAKTAVQAKGATPLKAVQAKKTFVGSKSDFIRKNIKKPTSEILALAKAQGVSFSTNLIYVVRNQEGLSKPRKPKAAKNKVAARVAKARTAPARRPSTVIGFQSDHERAWLRSTIEGVGSSRAIALLKTYETVVEQLLK